MTTAIVPLKRLAEAKSRLGTSLDAEARRTLVAWMLQRVLGACADAGGVDDVLVMAGDAAAAELAARHGVPVALQTSPGLRGALQDADALVAARDATTATLVLVADLPWCTAEDLDAVIAAAASERAVVIAPTGDGGTAALLRRPGTVIEPAFGAGSAAAHAALAARAGIPLLLCRRPGLGTDLDTPLQLRVACAALPELARVLGPLRPRQAS